jgi:hypothetical protein
MLTIITTKQRFKYLNHITIWRHLCFQYAEHNSDIFDHKVSFRVLIYAEQVGVRQQVGNFSCFEFWLITVSCMHSVISLILTMNSVTAIYCCGALKLQILQQVIALYLPCNHVL